MCRSPEEIVSSYRFPTLKVMDLVRKEGEHTTVLFLSKVETLPVFACIVPYIPWKHTRVLFIWCYMLPVLASITPTLPQVKLMGWETDQKIPRVLKQSDVEVVLGNSEVAAIRDVTSLNPVFARWF